MLVPYHSTVARNADDTLQPYMSNALKHRRLRSTKSCSAGRSSTPTTPSSRPRSGGRTSTRRPSSASRTCRSGTRPPGPRRPRPSRSSRSGDTEKDPLLAEAISLQGYEEGRHAEVLLLLTPHYGIPVDPVSAPGGPDGPDPARSCGRATASASTRSSRSVSSASGERAQFFPKAIDRRSSSTIMQEEARHILFIVNWAAYLRAQRPLSAAARRSTLWRAWNIVAQAFDRVKGALAMAGGDGQGATREEGPGDRARRDPGRLHDEERTRSSAISRCARFWSSASPRTTGASPATTRGCCGPMLVPSVVKTVVKVLPRKKASRSRPRKRRRRRDPSSARAMTAALGPWGGESAKPLKRLARALIPASMLPAVPALRDGTASSRCGLHTRSWRCPGTLRPAAASGEASRSRRADDFSRGVSVRREPRCRGHRCRHREGQRARRRPRAGSISVAGPGGLRGISIRGIVRASWRGSMWTSMRSPGAPGSCRETSSP